MTTGTGITILGLLALVLIFVGVAMYFCPSSRKREEHYCIVRTGELNTMQKQAILKYVEEKFLGQKALKTDYSNSSVHKFIQENEFEESTKEIANAGNCRTGETHQHGQNHGSGEKLRHPFQQRHNLRSSNK